MDQIYNRKELKNLRRELRQSLTPAEAKMWTYLRRSQIGRKFRRQHSIGKYIVDFYCPSEKLAIELDGEPHYTEEGEDYDRKRTEYLSSIGIRVIRFQNFHVFEDIEEVLDEIKNNFQNE